MENMVGRFNYNLFQHNRLPAKPECQTLRNSSNPNQKT